MHQLFANLIVLGIIAIAGLLVYEAYKNGWNWQKAWAAVLAVAVSLIGFIAGLIHLPGIGS